MSESYFRREFKKEYGISCKISGRLEDEGRAESADGKQIVGQRHRRPVSISLGADYADFLGMTRILLTEDNAKNVLSIKMNAEFTVTGGNPGGSHYGVIAYNSDSQTIANSKTEDKNSATCVRLSQTPAKVEGLREYDLITRGMENIDNKEAISLYLGLNNLDADLYIKDVTVEYKKSDAEKALDAAIESAEQVEEKSAELKQALADAKQYKISTTDDIDTAVLARQETIAQVAADLTEAIEQNDVDKATVTVQDTDGSSRSIKVGKGKILVLTSDESVSWTIGGQVLAIGKKFRYAVDGDVTIIARETTPDDRANGIAVGDVTSDEGQKVVVTYGDSAKDTVNFTFVTDNGEKATLEGQSVADYKGQSVEYTIIGTDKTIAYVYVD